LAFWRSIRLAKPRPDDGSQPDCGVGHDARQAAETARDAGVRLLALTHLSTRYTGGEIRDEARAVFERTEVPRDFDTIELPFPERGEPELVRWGAEPAPA